MIQRRTTLFLGGVMLSAAGCGGEAVHEDTSEAADALIFGTDDRLEHGQVTGTEYEYLARSTAAIVDEGSVSCANGTCALSTTPWTTARNAFNTPTRLCSDVRFRGQPALAGCTGFLVAPDLIATAGHCTSLGPPCTSSAIVFDFNADANGNNAPTSVPADKVYFCMSETKVFANGDDWALFRLDRPVPRPVLNVRYGTPVSLNSSLAIIGHPMGVPLKVSPTGAVTITNANDPLEFSHNVDSFSANSGSPVFDRLTGVVVGIHVRSPAYQPPEVPHWVSGTDASGSCFRERVCPTTGCPTFGYSEASRITRITDQVPLSAALVGVVN